MRNDIGQSMKSEIRSLIESEQGTLRQMDSKLDEMRWLVDNGSMSKDQQAKFMQSLDNK